MINEIELAKSDRSKCTWCRKQIGKGIPRGIEISYHNNHPEHHYCCYKCLDKKFDLDEEDVKRQFQNIKDLRKELKKMVKENKEIIIKYDIINNLESKNGKEK